MLKPRTLLAALLLSAVALAACGSADSSFDQEAVTATGRPGAKAGDSAVDQPANPASSADYGRPVQTNSGSYKDISARELSEMLSHKDFLLVNTHVPYEGEIEQTDVFIDYQRAAAEIGRLPADRGARIVVYCRSDRMSRIAIEEWLSGGYTNLYNLDGGFVAWEAAGYPLLHER
jgi:rhodanese-related sulfurtransferase